MIYAFVLLFTEQVSLWRSLSVSILGWVQTNQGSVYEKGDVSCRESFLEFWNVHFPWDSIITDGKITFRCYTVHEMYGME